MLLWQANCNSGQNAKLEPVCPPWERSLTVTYCPPFVSFCLTVSCGRLQRRINTTMLPCLVEYVKHKYINRHVLILCYQQQEENGAQHSPLSAWDAPQRAAKPEMARRELKKSNWLHKLNCQSPEKLNNVTERAVFAYTRASTPRSLKLVRASMPGSGTRFSSPRPGTRGKDCEGRDYAQHWTPTPREGAQNTG